MTTSAPAPCFETPPHLSLRHVIKAARYLYTLADPNGRQTRVSFAEWDHELGGRRTRESKRRLWEWTKSTLVAIGAPVRRERGRDPRGQRVDLVLERGAFAWAERALKEARARLAPPPSPTQQINSRRAQVEARRSLARTLHSQDRRSYRAIAAQCGVSVGTAWADVNERRNCDTLCLTDEQLDPKRHQVALDEALRRLRKARCASPEIVQSLRTLRDLIRGGHLDL